MNGKWVVLGILLVMLGGIGSATTVQIYPYGEESPGREVSNSTFTDIRNGAGTTTWLDAYHPFYIGANSTTPDRYDALYRLARIYNTSVIPDDATITGVTESAYINWEPIGLGGFYGGITGFTPGAPGVINAAEYNTFGNVRYATDVQYSVEGLEGNWTTWTYNAAGIAAINKTGYTNIMHRLKWDIDNDTTGLTWAAAENSGLFTNSSVGDDPPYLNITYIEGESGSTVNSTDATVMRSDVSESFPTIRSGVGTAFNDDPNSILAGIWADSNSSQYAQNARGILLLNTSSLPDDLVITRATLYLYGNSVEVGLGNISVVFTGFTPVTTTASISDYNKGTSPRYANNLTYADFNSGDWNIIELNAAGMAAINKTGNTPIMIRTAWDYGAVSPTWNTSAYSYLAFNSSGSGVNVPYLLINSETPVASFTQNITYGGNGYTPVPVQFNDTSTNTPTSWQWAYKNATVDWTDFSTQQNPVHSFSWGVYDIRLIATNDGGYTGEVKPFDLFITPGNDALNNITLYQNDNIWNVPIDTMPVDTKSSIYITNGLPSSFVYIAAGITPINVVTSAHAKQNLTYIEYPEFSDDIPYPIPDHPKIEDTGGDHHFLIYENDTNLLYEMYQPVQAENGTWSAYDAMRFNLSTYDMRSEPYPTTTAAGLAMTPGLIKYEEIQRGMINHSMLLWMYNTRDTHVWPARANGNWNNLSYPPFGQRFRLKASFDTTGYSPMAKTILEGLKKYGAMVSDNSGDTQAWVISADADPRWLDDGAGGQALFDEMQNVHGSDFEAVDVSSLMINKDSLQAYASKPTAHFYMNITSVGGVDTRVPVANFTIEPNPGYKSYGSTFNDTSTGTPTSWQWVVKEPSCAGSPGYTVYNNITSIHRGACDIGSFYVNLTVSNAYGSSNVSKTWYLSPDATPTPTPTPTATPTPEPTPEIPTYGSPASLTVGTRTGTIGGGCTTAFNSITYGGTYNSVYTAGVDAVVGGGSTYLGTTISNKSALLTALTGASTGDVIYIDPSANIDMGSSYNINVPAGVTIASNRGQTSTTLGGRIYTKTGGSGWNQPIFLTGGNGVRFTGLRLEGEVLGENGGICTGDPGATEQTFRVGITSHDYTLEVDNCELYGFAYADVYIYDVPAGGALFHHNYVHNSNNLCEGYGFNNEGGDMIVEGNLMTRNRHSVTGAGLDGETYTVRYNMIVGDGFINDGVHLDVHQDESDSDGAGARYDIYNNNVTQCVGCTNGYYMPFLEMLDSASTGAYVHHNVINTNWGAGSNDQGFSYPIFQAGANDKMFATNNYWKGTFYPTNTGVVQ